ncbi:actin binding protein [Pelomyxa schiedti]|nr:actin binding protein [Pelomyxa schiedti]
MSKAAIVRVSKYRHVFGTAERPEKCYSGVRIANTAWDTNFVAANTRYFAMLWESGGGGAFAVIPHETTGKLPEVPLVSGHRAAVLDLDWNPFNDSLIASCSEDCMVNVWNIPEGGLKAPMTTPVQTLSGHKRKVGTVNFHPCANNVLASTSADFTVKVWDIERGEEMFNVPGHADLIQSCSWNKNGSLLSTTCKDKKLRLVDPRAATIAGETLCHQGSKGSRALWLTEKDKILTVGFSRNSEREFNLYDPRNLTEVLAHQILDSMSGMIMPFYDAESHMVYLAGKGDGNVRYYELVDEKPFLHFLSEYKSSSPQRGACLLPKRCVNVSNCEVARMLKLTQGKVEPISFVVPRKGEIFQDDLYPDCFAGNPVESAEEWKTGTTKDPDMTFHHALNFVAPVKSADFNPTTREAEKPKTEKEIREEWETQKNRITYLEAELARRDARIKELEERLNATVPATSTSPSAEGH